MNSKPSDEFRAEILKVKGKRNRKIKNCYNVADYFAYYKKTKPDTKEFSISQPTYSAIIKNINNRLRQHLIEDGELKLPCDMGILKIHKTIVKPKVVDNKLIYNSAVDWQSTMKLWEDDPESKVAKTVVKFNPGDRYRIKYLNKRCRLFKNKEYFIVLPTREWKHELVKAIKDGLVNNFFISNKRTLTSKHNERKLREELKNNRNGSTV